MRVFVLAPLLLTALVAAAQGTPAPTSSHHEIRWDDRGGAALRTQVAAGRWVEWCGPIKVGEVVNWEFQSADPLDFNVHWHEGATTIHYPVQKDSVQLWSGRLVGAAEQTYCWMWTNRSATPIALQARLQKATRAG